MTDTSCRSCTATIDNGLALCDACRVRGTVDLQFIPVYFANLARWRPGRAGSRQVPGSRVLYDGSSRGSGDRVIDALDTAVTTLADWAAKVTALRLSSLPRPRTMADAVLTGDLPDDSAAALATDPTARVTWLCRAFEHHLTSIATLDNADVFLEDTGRIEATLRALTEDVAPGWYAGACRRCTAPTYVVPGLTWVTCGACGATTYARDHLDTILDEARDWVARPRRLAEAAVALLDTEQSVPRLYERIKKWEQRERLTGIRRLDIDGREVGPKSYRFGDVLDLVRNEGATRLNRTGRRVS